MARRVKKESQLHLDRLRWGGRRDGAGRPKTSTRVSHLRRPRVSRNEPVHVTIRVRKGLPSLRSRRMVRAVRQVLGSARSELGLTVREHSVQGTHIHIIGEVEGRAGLSRGMQGLNIRLARAINRVAERTGKVFADRYQVEVLRTPRQVKNALAYVLNNLRHHEEQIGFEPYPRDHVDELSSAPWFAGWRIPVKHGATGPPPHAPPRTWLLRTGWRRHGLLDPGYVPGRR
jgi:REP element-mobilizing transposase RayT